MNTLEKNKSDLESYGYKLVTWDEFLVAPDRPEGLTVRAYSYYGEDIFTHIVYDPSDDEDGFMLVGTNPEELASDTCNYISDMFPEEGPLAV